MIERLRAVVAEAEQLPDAVQEALAAVWEETLLEVIRARLYALLDEEEDEDAGVTLPTDNALERAWTVASPMPSTSRASSASSGRPATARCGASWWHSSRRVT